MSFFKAYDMRGTFGADFDLNTVYKIGRALPGVLRNENNKDQTSSDNYDKPFRILIGRDARTTSPAVRNALVAGLKSVGAEVTDLGLATTPMVYFFTAEEDFDGSVMITASHNPPTDNGLKVSRRGALPVGYDSGLSEVESLIANDDSFFVARSDDTAIASTDSVRLEKFIGWLKANAGIDLQTLNSMRFAVDCSDGMASILAHELFPNAVFLNDIADGTFPHHSPNPLLAEAREQLRKCVVDNRLACGVIFDGDADRCMFVDEEGNFIQPDFLIPVLASTFPEVRQRIPKLNWPMLSLLGAHPEGFPTFICDLRELPEENNNVAPKVIHDVRTSRTVTEILSYMCCEPVIGKVGHAYAKVLLRETNAVCGGELAGHYYFRDFHYCDSGELAALRILGAFARMRHNSCRTVSNFIGSLTSRYANSGEMNFKVDDKPSAIKRVLEVAETLGEVKSRIDIDGVRLEYDKGWISIRQSNTEPYLRLIIECIGNFRLDEWKEKLSSAIY